MHLRGSEIGLKLLPFELVHRQTLCDDRREAAKPDVEAARLFPLQFGEVSDGAGRADGRQTEQVRKDEVGGNPAENAGKKFDDHTRSPLIL